jgi:glutamate synthase (NADPH/NADH) small chain
LERFVADYSAAHPELKPVNVKKAKAPKKQKKGVKSTEPIDLKQYTPKIANKKVAIIGAGPAGLSCAATLAKLGVKVSVFEAFSGPGGVLIYGIPEFRLPKEVVRREALAVEKMGVDFRFNYPVGNAGSVPGLLANGFDAVFIGTGAGLPYFLGVPGDDLAGVYSSNEFLTRVNLMKAYQYPDYQTPVLKAESVAVFGGGNVAMDAARCSKRLGAKNVYICYRRTKNEMPARIEELHHAIEEGVIVMELVSPVRIVGDAKGLVTGVELQPMELGAPDAKGRRAPVKSTKPAAILPVEQIIVSIGNGPNPMLTKNWPELALNKNGNISVDGNQMTNVPGVFAGGDIVTGAATVILAMGAGKKASIGIAKYLAGVKE